MSQPSLHRFDVADERHGFVPAAALVPAAAPSAAPLCLFLYGGGGSRESLADFQPVLDELWATGRLPPLVVATADVGPFSFYLDDPKRGLGWETFMLERLIPFLRRKFQTAAMTGLVGMSMGGYGALKFAFGRPGLCRAVAAVSPMLEPALEAASVPWRNRYHYPPQVPEALLGVERDAELYRADHPAGRAIQNAASLRVSELGIYIDAAGADVLHAHDGAEYLHRVLWDLDIAHEYKLRCDSDHVGPDLVARLCAAFCWVGARLVPVAAAAELDPTERAWQAWLDGQTVAPPAAALAPSSRLFPRVLRAQLTAARRAAEARDPTLSRRYGRL